MEIRDGVLRVNLEDTVGLAPRGGDLGHKLGAGNPYGCRDAKFCMNLAADEMADVHRGPKTTNRASHVQEASSTLSGSTRSVMEAKISMSWAETS